MKFCERCETLIASSRAAFESYRVLAGALRENMGRLPEAEYASMRTEVELARQQAESADRKLAEHRFEATCTGQVKALRLTG